jgi:hypothetical protein
LLQGAGLVARARKRGVHRKASAAAGARDAAAHRRQSSSLVSRRALVRPAGDLDDATSEIYYAQLVEEESTVTVMAGAEGSDRTQRAVLRPV